MMMMMKKKSLIWKIGEELATEEHLAAEKQGWHGKRKRI